MVSQCVGGECQCGCGRRERGEEVMEKRGFRLCTNRWHSTLLWLATVTQTETGLTVHAFTSEESRKLMIKLPFSPFFSVFWLLLLAGLLWVEWQHHSGWKLTLLGLTAHCIHDFNKKTPTSTNWFVRSQVSFHLHCICVCMYLFIAVMSAVTKSQSRAY